MFGIGVPELIVILLIAFLVLGPEKVISLARSLGRMAADLKKKSGEMEAKLLSGLEEEEKEKPGRRNSGPEDDKHA